MQPDEDLARHLNRPAFVWRGDLLAEGMGVKGYRLGRVVEELASQGTTDIVLTGRPWSNSIRIAAKVANVYGIRVHAVLELETDADGLPLSIRQDRVSDMVRQVERLVTTVRVSTSVSTLPIGIQARAIASTLNNQSGVTAVITDDVETSALWGEYMQALAESIWLNAQKNCDAPVVVTPVGGGALLWALMMGREHLGMKHAEILGFSVTYNKAQLAKRFKAFERRLGILRESARWSAGTTNIHRCTVKSPWSPMSAELGVSARVDAKSWDPVYHQYMLEKLSSAMTELDSLGTPIVLMTGMPQYDPVEFNRRVD